VVKDVKTINDIINDETSGIEAINEYIKIINESITTINDTLANLNVDSQVR